jgi:hypothetical protein
VLPLSGRLSAFEWARMRWTEEQLAEHQARVGRDTAHPPFKLPANDAGAFARGRLPGTTMNGLETAYAAFLEARKTDRDVLWWKFQPMRLRLADGAFYKPDFGVLTRECLFELHETKGFWREASRVRIKIAAEQFPFRFIAITRAKAGGWEREEFA